MEALRAKDATTLKDDLRTLRQVQLDLRFQKAFGQLENTAKPGRNRKNIARVLTVLREKQIQRFLLTDPEVSELLGSGGVSLSAGKNDPKGVVSRGDIDGNDARSITLAMRLWAQLRRNPEFFARTQQLPRI
ncbi:50S ribosomal protein L29 [Candidatus Poribacteria bacterium]|nr:50S ribosomal protein L29 [Candidatus Poribacteria bacterium]